MELSLRAEDSERRTRNAWTVMTPANVRIALHCDADAVLHFALMLIHPGFVASQRFLALHLTRASNPSHPAATSWTVPRAPVPPPPRAAHRSIRCWCGVHAVLSPFTSAACVCGWPAGKGGERGCERGRGGRHFEVIEITTIKEKMLKEKVPNNIGWTSAADHQTNMLASHRAACGST